MLDLSVFRHFYSALNDGHTPFSWQNRVLEYLTDTGRWPDLIDSPTGSGKSSVIDIHVFANAMHAAGSGPRVPRRLAMVVNRRAIVDSHAARAEQLAKRLREALDDPSGVADEVLEVARALRSISATDEVLRTTSIRGGLPTERSWVDEPETTGVISATPAMWGSRVLFRGYGTSRKARPREAGLLAIDCVAIVDEAHLSRQLVRTARNIAEMTAPHAHVLGEVPALQVVSTTATPDSSEESSTVAIGVTDADLAVDAPTLRDRLTRTKRLRLLQTAENAKTPAARRRYSKWLADRAEELRGEADAAGQTRTVLVVVNSRATAVELADELARRVGSEAVACWIGRMRELDLNDLRRTRPGLFTVEGDPDTRFLVATQTVEVGVDIDCAALLTELASGSALAQRFGRINRLGRAAVSDVWLVVPDGEIKDQWPYSESDLVEARKWLDELSANGDVSPWKIRHLPPPQEGLDRFLLSDLRRGELDLLARTTDDLGEEPELEFWLADSLEQEPEPVGVVLRNLPASDESAFALIRVTPPTGLETFPTDIRTARQLIENGLGSGWLPRVFRWSDEEVLRVDDANTIRPGDTLIVDPHPVTRMNVIVPEYQPSAPVARTIWGDEETQVFFDDGAGHEHDWCGLLAGESPEDAQQLFSELSGTRGQVILGPLETTGRGRRLEWVVIRSEGSVAQDEVVRQEWSPSKKSAVSAPVLLSSHANAVSKRAVDIATRIGLAEHLTEALRLAGLHHDDGKADRLFQKQLRDASDRSLIDGVEAPLAKSTGRNAQQVRRRSAARPGWRHEQLSAVFAAMRVGEESLRNIVVRLAGTSHGYGRPFFPLGIDELLDDSYESAIADVAQEMFGTGAGWSDVLEATDMQYGVWGAAYLEAVVRAADGMASKEGL